MDDLHYFTLIDYLVFGVLLLLSALIGVWFGFFAKQKQDSTVEYLMGGKTMGIFPISMSLIASSISGISLLAIPAEMYIYGTQFVMVLIPEVIASVIMVAAYIPVFYKLQITSSYEYLNLRFGRNVRTVGSLLFLVKMFLYIPVVIYVPGLAFSQVTGINVHLVTPIVCIVCIFYTTIGGLKAVVWTDTLQTVLMYGGVLTVIVLGTVQVGGIAEVLEKNRISDRLEFFNMDIDPTVRLTFWSVMVGDLFNVMSSYAVNQAMMQRCLAMPNLRSLHIMVVIFTIGIFLIVSMCCYTGVLIFAMFHDCDPVTTKTIGKADQLLPFFVLNISGSIPGLAGLFVAGVFSAALSTMSTGLNSMTGVISEDLLRPFLKKPISEKRASTIMKVMAAVIGVVCTALVFLVEKMGALLQVGMSLSAITSGALLGVFTLGMFFPWANSKGAMTGCLVSVLTVAWLSVGSQVAIATNQVIHPQKSLSLAGCPADFNVTAFTLPEQDPLPVEDLVLMPYRISFMYYTMIGTVTVIVVGLVVSFLTDAQDPRDLSPDVLTPVIHRFLPRRDATDQVLREKQPLKGEADIKVPICK